MEATPTAVVLEERPDRGRFERGESIDAVAKRASAQAPRCRDAAAQGGQPQAES